MSLNLLPADINNLILNEQKSRDKTIEMGGNLASQLGKNINDSYIDTERNILKTAGNFTGDVLSSGRYIAKNAVALVDNTQDNITTILQDIRVDVTNTIQIGLIIAVIGIAAFMIIYGDKIIDRGINISGLELF